MTLDPITSPEHVFIPDHREMGWRHKTARDNYIHQMRKYGNTPKGRAAAEHALFHARQAMHHFKTHAETVRRSR